MARQEVLVERPVLGGTVLGIFAAATGAVVANLYYCQPVLPQIAHGFHESVASATFFVTATQIGYATGLALVVPVGDLVARKRLVPSMFGVAAVGCAVSAAAPTPVWFTVASVLVGASSVAGQIMIPFVADFAPAERRSRSVALLMSGLLVGILCARTFSGFIAQAFGWRAVYGVSAALMGAAALALAILIPREPVRPRERYGELLRATVRLLATGRVLRRRSLLGAFGFGAFAVLWSSLAWQLSRPPFALNAATIGLFGLVGVVGVGAANFVGRMADTHAGKAVTYWITIAACVLDCAAFALFLAGSASLVAIVAGIVLLDAGTQGIQLSNQTLIYAIHAESRSRITSAYMCVFFLGGTVGSALAGVALEHSGWRASSAVGLAFAVGTVAFAAAELVRARPAWSVEAAH